jgi:hypothetical protein
MANNWFRDDVSQVPVEKLAALRSNIGEALARCREYDGSTPLQQEIGTQADEISAAAEGCGLKWSPLLIEEHGSPGGPITLGDPPSFLVTVTHRGPHQPLMNRSFVCYSFARTPELQEIFDQLSAVDDPTERKELDRAIRDTLPQEFRPTETMRVSPANLLPLMTDLQRWLRFLDDAIAARVAEPRVESPPALRQYVTLDQAAAAVQRRKDTLRKNPRLPLPDVDGGGRGKPNEWLWSTIRPFLEHEYGRELPERFPETR